MQNAMDLLESFYATSQTTWLEMEVELSLLVRFVFCFEDKGSVASGNGTFTIDECHFENYRALNGGAIWGDYSEQNRCLRASAGSRITILLSM